MFKYISISDVKRTSKNRLNYWKSNGLFSDIWSDQIRKHEQKHIINTDENMTCVSKINIHCIWTVLVLWVSCLFCYKCCFYDFPSAVVGFNTMQKINSTWFESPISKDKLWTNRPNTKKNNKSSSTEFLMRFHVNLHFFKRNRHMRNYSLNFRVNGKYKTK